MVCMLKYISVVPRFLFRAGLLFVIIVQFATPITAYALAMTPYTNADVGMSFSVPKAWGALQESKSDASSDAAQSGESVFVGHYYDVSTMKVAFSARAMSADYHPLYADTQANVFSPEVLHDQLADVCVEPGVVHSVVHFVNEAASWNTVGTIAWTCVPQAVGGESSFIAYEFVQYPEASGYGIIARSFGQLFGPGGSPLYAGVELQIELPAISAKVSGMMSPLEWDQSSAVKAQSVKGEKLAIAYLKKLVSPRMSGVIAKDKRRLKEYLGVIKSWKEL